MTRLAFIHTGAVVISEIDRLVAAHMPDVDVHHLLDSRIVGDLGAGFAPADVAARLTHLAAAAERSGARAVMFSCSSISGFADEVGAAAGIPVWRIDEAMADQAVGTASKIAVIATLPTTLTPTVALLRERADLVGRHIDLTEALVDGAFEAVSAGDRTRHDELVAAAITEQASTADVIVLAQASMAGVAGTVTVDVPVLTSPEPGIERAAEALA